MKRYIQAIIESQVQIGPNAYSMILKAPHITEHAKPGQFVMIYLNKGEMLLARPISLCDVDKHNGTITLIYVAIGAGTKVMSQWQAGQTINIMGPIGSGFSIENLTNDPLKPAAIVAGGMGVPPMLFLLKQMAQRGINTDVYLGFKHKYDLPDLFKPFAINLQIATDDGSIGQKGTVMDLLAQNKTYQSIFSCGPIPMLKALASYAKSNNTPCQVALEERMACGIGACKGCVVKTMVGYMLCCTYGPVFDSQEVNWDA